MLVCGFNQYSQLDKKSTNKNSYGCQIIDQPCEFHVNPSSISSFSTNNFQTVWITHDGKSYVTGNNYGGRISGSLPKERLPEDTEHFLKDDEGQPCKFVSVVCGFDYTLHLVSSESGVTNFKLVFCYEYKTTNPLFVNIGNRTPRAIFGGNSTSGVIDTEGGIIVLTKSVFESPRKEIEATFLPSGDKPVKLACCNEFVIALGMSGRVYESKISSINKFEIVKELSDSTVVDVSGTDDFCFAVLNDGRVFGRGSNSKCKLGLPIETKSVSAFRIIESLKKHEIVSVFTGTYHSIFKTTENKMIVCGSNDNGQLFIPLKDKEIVYPPEEFSKCQGFTFCVTGSSVSTAFFDIEPPKFSNKKIIGGDVAKVKTKSKVKDENKKRKSTREIERNEKKYSEKEEEIQNLKKEILNLQKVNSSLQEENSELKTRNKECENRLKKNKEENSEFKEELIQLKKKIKELPNKSQQKPINKEFEILDEDTISGLEKIEKISSNNNGKILKVAKKAIYVLKVMKNKNITHKQLQHFIAEYEILNALNHPNILKTYGIFYGNKELAASILLEYCPMNLDEAIKYKKLSKIERVCSIYEIASGLKLVHFHHIIHRDIKPSNILISKDGHMKVLDFGISRLVSSEDESMTSGIGTQKFMAPEIINEEEYNEKVDIYSFGVLVYFIISNGQMPKITITQVGIGKKATIPSDFTEFAHELIDSCWNFNPEDRPSFENICSLLKDRAHQLIDVTPSEIKEIQIFIENHQKTIPEY